MKCCCKPKTSDLVAIREQQGKVLKIVLWINFMVLILEFGFGVISRLASLLTDSLRDAAAPATMKRSWVLFLLFGFRSHAETVNIRFEEIPKIVSERNQHAQGAQLFKKSAEALQGHLGRSYLPKLSADIGSEKFKTGTQEDRSEPFGSITAKINVYRGGKDRLQDEITNARSKAITSDSDKSIREEIKKARASYWILVSGTEIAKLLEETIEENQKNLNSAEKRIRAGAATETDRIEFEMYKIELTQDLARLKLATQNAERELAVVLGLPEGTNIQVPAIVDHDHNDELLSTIYKSENHPAVSSLSYRASEADLQAAQVGRWWTPSVDLYAGYGLYTFREREYTPQSERYESIIGVQLSMDLFDGFNGRAERNQKAFEAAGLQKESEQTARELKAKVDGVKAELKLTHELIHQSEDALKRAKSYLTRTLDEYRRGVKNSPDVLSASERNFAMLRRFAELRRDYQLARSELLETLGL